MQFSLCIPAKVASLEGSAGIQFLVGRAFALESESVVQITALVVVFIGAPRF